MKAAPMILAWTPLAVIGVFVLAWGISTGEYLFIAIGIWMSGASVYEIVSSIPSRVGRERTKGWTAVTHGGILVAAFLLAWWWLRTS